MDLIDLEHFKAGADPNLITPIYCILFELLLRHRTVDGCKHDITSVRRLSNAFKSVIWKR